MKFVAKGAALLAAAALVDVVMFVLVRPHDVLSIVLTHFPALVCALIAGRLWAEFTEKPHDHV